MQDSVKTYLFPERLKDILITAGWSQEKFADRLGIARPTVSSYVVGKTSPDAKTLFTMAQALNVSADYLLGLTDSPATVNAPKTYANIVNLIDTISEMTGWPIVAQDTLGFDFGNDETLYRYYKTLSNITHSLANVNSDISADLVTMFKQRQLDSELNIPCKTTEQEKRKDCT